MTKKQILIVEDDCGLNLGIAMALSGEADCRSCYTRMEARKALEERRPDLVLLDVNLPDGSGLELLREIRAGMQTPVILLTANDLEVDVVTGLSLGADDYVTKPFSLAILRARVQVQLRRSQREEEYVRGEYRFSFEDHLYKKGEKKLELSRTEERILQLLVRGRGATVSREQLLAGVWNEGYAYVEENALSVSINRLRSKLGEKDCIRTVYGVGYAWKERT